jgi:hypothetical protein
MSTDKSNLTAVEELRELVFGQERLEIDNLKGRLVEIEKRFSSREAFEAEVTKVFSGALRTASGKERVRLVSLLSGLLTNSIRQEIRLAQPEIAEAIFPVASQLVAEGIKAAFQDLAKKIERQIAQRLSFVEVLKVKATALLTKRTEAEIWLDLNPPFDIEQAFVIHRQTGLLISSYDQSVLSNDGDTSEAAVDVDLLSGMLTAVMSFARDALPGESGRGLRTLEFADGNLLIRESPALLVVLRVKGTPSEEFVENFEMRFQEFLRKWTGELSVFEGSLDDSTENAVKASLKDLVFQLEESVSRPGASKTRKRGFGKYLLLSVLIIGVVVGAFYLGREWFRDRQVAQVQQIIDNTGSLHGYALLTRYDNDRNLVRVSGLVPTRFVAEELRENLRRELDDKDVSLSLRVLYDELVAQTAREQTALMVTNSRGVKKLETALSLIKQQLGRFDTELSSVTDGTEQGQRIADSLDVFNGRLAAIEEFMANSEGLRISPPNQETILNDGQEDSKVDGSAVGRPIESLGFEDVDAALLNSPVPECRDQLNAFIRNGLDAQFVESSLANDKTAFTIGGVSFDTILRCAVLEFGHQAQLYDKVKADVVVSAIVAKAWGELGLRKILVKARIQTMRGETENKHFAERIGNVIKTLLIEKGMPLDWIEIVPVMAKRQGVGNGSSWRTGDFVYLELVDKKQPD